MKNVSIYRGIKNANLRALIFKDFWALKVKPLDPEDIKELAHQLLAEKYYEDKSIGMFIFEKNKERYNIR